MITKEEKKIIKNIENIIEMTFFPSNFGKGKVFINIDLDHIKVLLNLIEKQDKMIDLMAQTLLNYGFVLIKSKNGLKEYFRKKVENEK